MLVDAKAIVVDGVPFTVKLAADDMAKPTDYDCYSKADVRAWQACAWRFVGVIVVNESTGADDSVWGVEYGTLSSGFEIGVSDIASRDDITDMCRGLL